ncbi:4-alpha-glucanotransferase [Telmatospirillum sp.]|uniref:4-alpha-glucanotransferase n=1 Tax=Telmatospirillum sp. TaxID=2079197 RepID=UPI00283DAB7E|nr:4-alpha-glucanotransferase [Telmatospirillum sp.]MDR3437753.1 4-alpha-glucanotransferase [Telmatospirillum sp.]
MVDDPLERLAALAGIEAGWIDFFGERRVVSDETKRAFLTAMGFDVASERAIAASFAEFETRSWRHRLPPVLVVSEEDGPPTVTVAVPVRKENQLHEWAVLEENGALHTGQWRPRDLPLVGRRDVDGEAVGQYRFLLPGVPLPGIHRLRVSDEEMAAMTLIVAPSRAHLPSAIERGQRLWGYATQLYALRSERNWGVGDFSDLADLAGRTASQGGAAVGFNPLHALFASRPERFSPYSPSSRTFLNIAFIDVEAVPDVRESAEAKRLLVSTGFQTRLAAARAAELVDYPAVAALKRPMLAACWQSFRKRHLAGDPDDRGADFRRFQQAGGRNLRLFATFEALQAEFLARDPTLGYWRAWPPTYHDPDGPGVRAFAETHGERIEFHIYLQWVADTQLRAAKAECDRVGMPIGLYRDLAVGIADDGAEAWANQSLLCLGVSVGAPPDPLNLSGQDWGLVPFNPLALRDAAYLPFLDVLEANMRHAGAMRLDHAMSLQRLYWVPQGAKADQGAYVRYPVDDLFRLTVLASRRQRCLIIGEDLGTVPEGFRERMVEKSILGYRLLVFEKDQGKARPAEVYPSQALVGFGTHDLPSLAGWWKGIDVEARRKLTLYPDPAMGDAEMLARAEDRRLLVEVLADAGLLEPTFPVDPEIEPDRLRKLAIAVHVFLARTPAKLLMVQFEDLLGMTSQMNLPGTVDQHPNWRLRYPLDIAAMLAEPDLTEIAAMLSRERDARADNPAQVSTAGGESESKE